jgi:hypothetical protein
MQSVLGEGRGSVCDHRLAGDLDRLVREVVLVDELPEATSAQAAPSEVGEHQRSAARGSSGVLDLPERVLVLNCA